MGERWQGKLRARPHPVMPAERIWADARMREAPSEPPIDRPPRRVRVATAIVALAVFVPVVVLAWMAFRSDGGSDAAMSDVFFPTWEGNEVPGALLSGVLVEHDGCLFLSSGADEALILWERGYSMADGVLLDEAGTPVARVGDAISGGGGLGAERGWAEQITGTTIPEACIPSGPEPYAMLYDVELGTPPAMQVEVPDLVGLTESDARRALDDLGLEVSIRELHADDTDVPVGTVSAQDPAAGTTIDPGSSVVVSMYAGPAAAIPVGDLPQVGIVVADIDGAVLLDVDGNELADLSGFHLAGNPGAPGVWLERQHRFYILDPSAGALVEVDRRVARDSMYEEGPWPDLSAPPGAPGGHWRYQLFPDRGTASLGQWSGECEIPTVYWIDADGTMSIVTGEASLRDAPESMALGWTPEGAALVFLPGGACGSHVPRTGVYRYSAPGDGTLLYETAPVAGAEMWDVP